MSPREGYRNLQIINGQREWVLQGQVNETDVHERREWPDAQDRGVGCRSDGFGD